MDPRHEYAYRQLERGGICWLCDEEGADTIDHVLPVSAGGTNDPWNLRPAHRACNSAKGDKVITCGHPLWAPRSIASGRCSKCHPGGPNEVAVGSVA